MSCLLPRMCLAAWLSAECMHCWFNRQLLGQAWDAPSDPVPFPICLPVPFAGPSRKRQLEEDDEGEEIDDEVKKRLAALRG